MTMKFFHLTIFISSILLTFCFNSFAQNYIGGEIKNDTTITNVGNPYILTNDLIVKENVTLTLAKGVIIKPIEKTTSIQVFGTLQINGTLEEPVVFTSYADDDHGGDSNGDGDLTGPKSGDWGAINFYYPGKNNRIKNAWIGYGSDYTSKGVVYNKSLGLEIDSCTFYGSAAYAINSTRSVTIRNSTIDESQSGGVLLDLVNASAEINIFNNTFTNNKKQAVLALLAGTKVEINSKGNICKNSELNGIYIKNNSIGNLTFNGDSLLPLIMDNGLVEQSTIFKIEEGSWIAFTQSNSQIQVMGTMLAQGAFNNPIVFTSIKDIYTGTEEIDSLNAPKAGDWNRIGFYLNSKENKLKNVEFRYGGYNSASVLLNSLDVEIDSCVFMYSNNSGIQVDFSLINPQNSIVEKEAIIGSTELTDLKIENCSFISNIKDGIFIHGNRSSGNLIFLNNVFTGNRYPINVELSEFQNDIILDGNQAVGNNKNGFYLNGGISGNVNLDFNLNFPYIFGNLIVNQTGTLNLKANTIIKFDQPLFGFGIKGNLVLEGTQNEPVVFTSIKDDSYGGDTNNDGESTPEPGDWYGIQIYESAGNLVLENCWFGYGNQVRIDSDVTEIKNCTFEKFKLQALKCNNTSPDIHNNRFIGNQKCGVYYNQVKTISLTDNYFEDNQIPVIFNYDSLSWDIQPIDNQNTFSGKGIKGFGISGKITGDVIFHQNKTMPFVIYGLDIQPDAKLTFPAGGIYKFAEAGILVNGSIDILGTKEGPVVFTSVKDDARGGDVNGDGTETNPGRGDWGGISFHSNFDSKISHLWMGYGGGEYSTGGALLSFNNSGRKNFGSLITVENCVITKSRNDGISLRGNSQPEIRNCKIFDNFEDGIHADHSQPVITNNEIYDNGFYGVRNSTQQQNYNVDARNNFWGDSSGPFHSVKNPKGKGDYVSDFVLFDPYMNEPVIDWIIQKTNLNFLTEQIEIYPVPANQKVAFSVYLKKQSQLKINILSIEGKVVDVIFYEYKPAGKSVINYSVKELKNGIYLVEFLANQERQVRKLVVSNQIL